MISTAGGDEDLTASRRIPDQDAIGVGGDAGEATLSIAGNRRRRLSSWVDDIAPGESINLRDLVLCLLRGWWIVAVAMVAAFSGAILYLAWAPVEYRATLVLSAVPESSGSSVTPASSVSALTSLIGGTIAQTEQVSNFMRFRYLLTSREVAQRLIERHDMLKKVFASEWDEQTDSWHPSRSFSARVRRALFNFLALPSYAEPSADRLAAYLESRFEITNVEATPMIEVSFNHGDPTFARMLLDMAYRETDALMREQDRIKTEEAVAYLSTALATVSLADHRLVVQQLLSRNLARLMLFDTDQAYAALLLEPPYASALPTSPQPTLVLALAFLGGLVFGVLAVLFANALRAR